MHKKRFFCGSVQKYYYYVQKYCLFWGPCRNITIQEPGEAGFSCRAIFGVCADIFIFGEIFTSATHARIFWPPFFYQVTVLKMAIFYSNFTVIVCFLVIFVIIIIKITKIIIIIIIETIIIIIKKNFGHTRKTSFLTSKKEDQVARIGVRGGGLGDSGNARKKTFFFYGCLPQ